MSDSDPSNAGEAPVETPLMVVELKKKYSADQLKKLRKGKGKLYRNVRKLVDELTTGEGAPEKVQPVVIVVQEKGDDGWW